MDKRNFTEADVREYSQQFYANLSDNQVKEIVEVGNKFDLKLSRAYSLITSDLKKYLSRYNLAKFKLMTTIPTDSEMKLYRNDIILSKKFIDDGAGELEETIKKHIYNSFYKTVMSFKVTNVLRRKNVNSNGAYIAGCELYSRNEKLRDLVSKSILGKDSYEEYFEEIEESENLEDETIKNQKQ